MLKAVADALEIRRSRASIALELEGEQGEVADFARSVRSFHTGTGPNPADCSNYNGFFQVLLNQCSYFFSHDIVQVEEKAGSTKKRTIHSFGLSALKDAFKETEAKMETEPESCTIIDLKKFKKFRYALSYLEQTTLKGWHAKLGALQAKCWKHAARAG